ncbi:restriction endonuclease subunit S [Shewanella oncorhynchi]|uniref:restriction endonuclease subunit S n=1 Tax=Shewanella oncorhynchi TaxID=2726434 RepID=UPI002E7AC24A|nr:restriction endonuclease subunit S [Shewanella oncorhynchi]WVI93847.1 restriction endonuclease subunit S [Shewanella oncorhynchi]
MSNLVPDGWYVTTVGESCFVTKLAGYEYTSHFDYSIGGEIIAVRVLNLKKGKLDLSKVQTIPKAVSDALPRSKLAKNDLVISYVGTVGEVAFIDKDNKYHLAPNVAKVTPDSDKINGKYLAQVFTSDETQKSIKLLGSITSQPSLSMGSLRKVSLLSPPLPEQQKIAAILTSVDNVIEKTQAQIDKLKDLKSGMMQELLTKGVGIKQGDKYEPHTEFKDSPVGRIPKNWQVVSLENLVKDDKKITYGIVQAGPHHEGGIPYIRVSDMNSRYLTKKGMLLTSPEIAKKFERSAVSAGDIVYALRGMIGHVHIIPNELDGANLTQGTARISPSSNIDTGFLLWAMRSPYVAEQNDLEAKGSTFKEVTLASLRKIQIAVPLDNEQKFISAVLTSVESKIFATEDKLEQTKNLKKALMQDLLTGKVRVKVDNDLVS